MKLILALLLSFFVIDTHSALARGIADVDRMVYGETPFGPSPDSLLGKYLAETHAKAYARAFPREDGTLGPQRLVVFVSPQSFPTFQKYFTGSSFLYQYHEPHQHGFVAAFEGHRGSLGRLRDELRYTYGGVLLIPTLLTPEEGVRAHEFFNVALKVSRKNDIALYPWRLTNAQGNAYCQKRNEKSLAEWFVNLPIGKMSRKYKVEEYEVCSLDSEAQNEIKDVWSAPHGRKSLGDLLNIDALSRHDLPLTPGKIGAALLGSASLERVPVVFRYAQNHIEPATDEGVPLDENFSTYFDLDFNPIEECQ